MRTQEEILKMAEDQGIEFGRCEAGFIANINDTQLFAFAAALHEKFKSESSGKTCFVPPEFQRELDELKAKLIDIKMQRRSWLDTDKTALALLDQERELAAAQKELAELRAWKEAAERNKPIGGKSENGIEWEYANTVARMPVGTKLYIHPLPPDEAHDREVAAKALEDAAQEFEDDGFTITVSRLRWMVSELRATPAKPAQQTAQPVSN